MIYLMLVLGFVFLVKGADFLVEGTSDIARLLRIPSVIIGLTIVAMGTSAPEAAVSITAGFTGNNDIALGNVIGSNIFNLLVVVGACAGIKCFDIDKDILKRDFLVAILSTVILLIFVIDSKLSAFEGFVLLALMAGYIFIMIRSAFEGRTENDKDKKVFVVKSIMYTLGGIVLVVFGGQLVVNNAVKIAESFGISENLIALTIVAIGTSLPELVTSIVAAGKGNSGLALGNVVGSNIFNILFILGSSALLNPISATSENVIDVIVSLVFTGLVLLWCKFKSEINRPVGLIMMLCYIGYTLYIIAR